MTEARKQLRVGLVMAGGTGERFWPLSRRNRPKQLLHLTRPDKSMLAEAVERLVDLVGEEQTHVITGGALVEAIRAAGGVLSRVQVLGEPCKRNTAGAMLYAAAWLLARHAERDPSSITMAVTTADHRIGDEARFAKALEIALSAAEAKDALVVCGLAPTRPETGFGYIETDGGASVMTGTGGAPAVFRALTFHEKPDAARAAQFLAGGRHLWNSGMFFWKLSVFLEELRLAQPAMEEAIWAMASALRADDEAEVARLFTGLDSISIDYALMERSQRVLVVKADFPWADVGAWNAVDDPDGRDANGNHVVGDPVMVDCADCVVYNACGEAAAVGVVGMSNTVVVVTDDAVLVLPRDRAQDVRAVVEELKRRKSPLW